MPKKRNTFWEALGRVKARGVFYLVMAWLLLLRALPQDIPEDFP